MGFMLLSGLTTVYINYPPAPINEWFKDLADLMRPTYYRLKERILSW